MFRRTNLLVCGLVLLFSMLPGLLAAEVRGQFTGVQSLTTLQQITWSNVEAAYFHTDGHWIVRTSTQTTSSRVFPAAFATAFANGGVVAALGQNGGWVVVDENNNVNSGNMHLEFEGNLLLSQINNYLASGTVDSISFDPDGQGFVVVGNGSAYMRSAAVSLENARNYAVFSGRKVQHIAMGPNQSWGIVAENWVASRGVEDFHDLVRGSIGDGKVQRVGINDDGGFALWLDPDVPNSVLTSDSILNRFEKGNFSIKDQEETVNFAKYLETLGIVALSVTILQDGNVVESRGYGRISENSDTYVDDETRFQFASVSKSVTALAVMAAIQKYPSSFPNGLDTTIAQIGHPDVDQWAAGSSQNFASTTTLRHLMSYTAGLKGVSSGWYVHGLEPDLVELLDSYTAPWTNGPGTNVHYTGLGTMLLQLLLEEAVPGSTSFDEIVEDLLISPVGLTRTDYDPYTEWSAGGNTARRHCYSDTPSSECDGTVFKVANSGIYDWAGTAGFVSTTTEAARLLSVYQNGITPPGAPLQRRLISSLNISASKTPQKLANGQEVEAGLGVGIGNPANPDCRHPDGGGVVIQHGGKGANYLTQFLHNTVTGETAVFAFTGNGTVGYSAARGEFAKRLRIALSHGTWTECGTSGTPRRSIPMIPIVGRFEGGSAQVGIWQDGYIRWTDQNLNYAGVRGGVPGVSQPDAVKTGDVDCDGKDELLVTFRTYEVEDVPVPAHIRAYTFLPESNPTSYQSFHSQMFTDIDWNGEISLGVFPTVDSGDPGCANTLYYRNSTSFWLGMTSTVVPLIQGSAAVGPVFGWNAFWNYHSGNWSIHDGTQIVYTYPTVWGVSSEFVPFDWNLLFKPSTRTWYYRTSLSGGTTWSKNYGIQHDIPLHGVFNRGGVSRNSMVAFRPRDRKFFFFEIGGTATYHTVTFPYTD